MSVYLITYDLRAPQRNYDDLYEKIKSLGSWAHYYESIWFVETDKKSKEIFSILKTVVDNDDRLFITKVTKDYYGKTNPKLWDWLSQRV